MFMRMGFRPWRCRHDLAEQRKCSAEVAGTRQVTVGPDTVMTIHLHLVLRRCVPGNRLRFPGAATIDTPAAAFGKEASDE